MKVINASKHQSGRYHKVVVDQGEADKGKKKENFPSKFPEVQPPQVSPIESH